MSENVKHPTIELEKLDELWFQITGTRCNLECTHCFISCAPNNTTFGDIDAATVEKHLEASKAMGTKEYYFTGGEPFLHPEMAAIIAKTLEYGPVTVLTNGTIMTRPTVRALAEAAEASIYSIEFRVSIDHYEETKNDAIRGKGSFRRALQGASRLAEGGFLPIVTAMRTWEIDEDLEVIEKMGDILKAAGVAKPRIKFLPALKIGAEAERAGSYAAHEYVTEEMMIDFPVEQFVCSHSRIVTDRGVHVCPILIESEDSVLGQTLEEAGRGYELRHQACSTCYLFGSICTNATATVTETTRAAARKETSSGAAIS